MNFQWNCCINVGSDFRSALPPNEDGEYLDGFNFSIEVLFTDGENIHIGYVSVELDDYYDDGIGIEWHSGSEGFLIDNVTHWAFLPDLPQLVQ